MPARRKSPLFDNTPTFSFEFFPPKTEEGARALLDTVVRLQEFRPSFVSVTYGAGGGSRELTRSVRFIREWEDRNRLPNRLTIGVAGFCEGHPDTRNRIREMDYLKAKLDEGADYICTQLFFDNHAFFDYRDRCRLLGIDVPIIAGIMPVTSISSMNRMAELSAGTNFPARLLKAMLRAGGDKSSIERIGINYASNQCAELLDADVDGIHFYTLNRSKATLEIYHNLGINNYFDVDRIHMLSNIYKS